MLLARSGVASIFGCEELVCDCGPRLGCEFGRLVGDLLLLARVELV